MDEPVGPVRRAAHLAITTTEPTRFGSGFLSGLLSAILGIAGFGAVLCLNYPQYLTQARLREFYSLDYLRAIIHLTLVGSFLSHRVRELSQDFLTFL